MSQAAVVDRLATAAPATGYLGVWLAGTNIQDVVAVLTGVLIVGQLVKLALEFKDRRAAKRKESKDVPEKPSR